MAGAKGRRDLRAAAPVLLRDGRRGPDAGPDRDGPILYGDELLALLRGTPAKHTPGLAALMSDVWPAGARLLAAGRLPPVPLYRRQVYAVAVYAKARSSEMEALKPADIDLVHETVSITKQTDRKTKGRKGTKKTKTKRTREVDIEPNVKPLLVWLKDNPRGRLGRLLHMPPPEDRAELLRRDLLTVGLTREALHAEDSTRHPLWFHELRDTGLTHMGARGDGAIKIQWAGGHTDFKTTQGYIDRGRVEARRIGTPLPLLPPEVLAGIAQKSPRGDSQASKLPKYKRIVATPTGIEGPAEAPESPKHSEPLAEAPRDDGREMAAHRDASNTIATVRSNDVEPNSPEPLLRPLFAAAVARGVS